MGNAIYSALSGAVAQSHALDVTANNVANAGTVAYRADRVRFAEVLGRARGRAKDSAFVSAAATVADPTPGAMSPSQNPLDVALPDRDAYIGVSTARGVRFTRAGNLRLDGTGRLVTAAGDPVRDARGGRPILVPPGAAGSVVIASDGTVSAGEQVVGKIELARFAPAQLTREGATLFVAAGKPAAGPPPTIVQGALEQSNFNVVRGVVDLVRVSRAYEATHRLIEAQREIDDRTARGLGSGG
jgi:flagellar basal body rod protein FlgG